MTEGGAKSSARLLCLQERRHEIQGGDTLQVRSTAKVLQSYDDTTEFGQACRILRESMLCFESATTEVVFTRQYADS